MVSIAFASAAMASAAAPAEALVLEGRALYRGERPWREAPKLQGVPLPGAACVQCHGMRGEARSEGGVAVPSIRWQQLAQAGPQRPAYRGDAELLRALAQGHAPGGRPLAAPMPRYTLDAQESRALLAWLRVLGTEAAPVPGVTVDRVVLGTVLHLDGPQAAAGTAVRAALERGIARINGAGGLFGRRLALEVAAAGPDAASASAAAAALVGSGRVFLLVGAQLPEPDAALRDALHGHDSALVGALGQPTTAAPDRRIAWLLPSVAQQLVQLSAALPRHCPAARGGLRVLAWRHGALAALSAADAGAADAGAADAGAGITWQPIGDAAALQQALAGPPRPSVALLPPALVATVRDTLGRQGSCLGTLAVVSGAPPADTTAPELVGLPMPAVAASGSGSALWSLLAEGALATVAEALARAGRTLDIEGVLRALDGLDGLATPGGLRLAFGPQRRHGLEPAWIWKEGLSHDIAITPPPAPRP